MMTRTLQVSCVQMHWAKSLDFNLQRTLYYIKSAAESGSQVVLFPEASLTGYYFPSIIELDQNAVLASLKETCVAAQENNIWVIVGTVQKTKDRFLNLAHVINRNGKIVHEVAKVNMAGKAELRECIENAQERSKLYGKKTIPSAHFLSSRNMLLPIVLNLAI
jgi:predicted amidohydrolase